MSKVKYILMYTLQVWSKRMRVLYTISRPKVKVTRSNRDVGYSAFKKTVLFELNKIILKNFVRFGVIFWGKIGLCFKCIF